MKHVFAFDPGKMTGFAWMGLDSGGLAKFETKQYTFDEICDFLMASVTWAKDRNRDGHTFVVAIEKFTITPKTPNSPWSLEVTGVAKLFARLVGASVFEFRPSDTKRLIDDKALKHSGLWQRGLEHARDAIRVGAYYAVTKENLMIDMLFEQPPYGKIMEEKKKELVEDDDSESGTE